MECIRDFQQLQQFVHHFPLGLIVLYFAIENFTQIGEWRTDWGRSLHWLPVKFRITFKLCVLMHLVHIGRAPAYLSDIVTATADLPGRGRLRSSNTFWYELLLLKRKFGERSFSYAGQKLGMIFLCSSRTYWYVYFQKATENSSVYTGIIKQLVSRHNVNRTKIVQKNRRRG